MCTVLSTITNPHFAGVALAEVDLSEIDIPAGKAPRGLVRNIRQHGLMEPVILVSPARDIGQEHYSVVAGRRRLMALREIEAETVVAILQSGTLSENAGSTLSENLLRSRNLVSEVQAYRDLVRQDMTDEEIQVWLGLFKRDVKSLSLLSSMAPITESMLICGRLSPSAAKVLAKLDPEQQKAFFDQQDQEEGKFTLAAVQEFRKQCLFPGHQLSFLEGIPLS